MKNAPQISWGLVMASGHIDRYSIRCARRDVIRYIVSTYREYKTYAAWSDLTTTQFWRKLKRKNGFSVRRISMTVMR